MHARATTLQGSPDRADEAVEQYRASLTTFRETAGNRGAFLLVDRSAGKGIGVTLWESEQAMQESRQRADQLRQQAAEQAQGQIVGVEEYEVAVWDVS
jgi:heme-degrading monooxygenase HmoA